MYPGWDSIDRSRAAFRRRIEELDKKHCKSAEELTATMREMTELATEELRCCIAIAIMQCFANLILRTPVDTGRLRAGWRIGEANATLPGEGVYPVFKEKDQVVERHVKAGVSLDAGTRLYEANVLCVYNNVEYVLALNAGWSTKQAGGFIDLFLDELKGELAGIGGK